MNPGHGQVWRGGAQLGQGNNGEVINQGENPWPYAGNPNMSMEEVLRQATGRSNLHPEGAQMPNQ